MRKNMENNDKTKQIINNLINRIVDIETTINSVVEDRLNDIENKIAKIDSEILTMKSSMIDLNNVVFPNPTAYSIKPIQDGYISTILEKIKNLKQMIEEYFGSKDECEFSSWYLTVESIEKQIIETKHASEKQLRDLNSIYQKITLPKK